MDYFHFTFAFYEFDELAQQGGSMGRFHETNNTVL